MKICIENAIVFDGERSFENACVHIDGAFIVYAGPSEKAPAFDAQKRIDARGGIAMPGLCNAHTHMAMSLLRGLGSDLNLQDWLENAIFPAEDKLTHETATAGVMLSIMEQLRFGVTSFADMYYFMDGAAEAVKETGIRALLTRGLVGDVSADSTRLDENIDLIRRYHGACDGRIRCGLGTHAEYTNNEASLIRQAEVAREFGCSVHVHVSETAKEVAECKERHGGLSPVKYLYNLGLLTPNTLAAHCVHVDEEDIALLARSGASVAHNPISNLKLASGVMPLGRMLDAGINVALGTDGCASNNTLNLWEEIRLTAILHKGVSGDPTLITPRQVLSMATIGGARAMGFEDVGYLRPGYRADIILVDATGAHMQPCKDPAVNLTYSAQGSDVFMTMVDGKVLYEDGAFLTLDAQEVTRKAQEAVETVW